MKKRKSALLLISVFAAMTLASCGDDPAPASSKAALSSAADSSLVSDSSVSSDAGSLPASSAGALSSSQAGASSSLPPASSSAPHVETDWIGKPFVGQYQGGFTALIINEDMTTSWDTDTTHFPAKYEIMANGVYHIYSDDSVASDDKVDVYTDGTMAYVIHDAAAKDAFLVDKAAEYQAANAMAKKADGSLLIGSIVAGSKTKFFRLMNGAYEFNISVEVGYGDSIEAAGAIFDVVVGNNSSTYRVVTAGNSGSGLVAVIEDYTVIRTTYHGASGDLIVARNGEEIVYITLDGQDIDLENVVVDGDGNITIKDGERRLDNSDPSHMIWVYGATKYTLDEANHAYSAEDATSNEDVFQALDLSANQMSAVLGSDGNLWATFTPTVGGFLNINIIVGVDYDTYDGYYDDHITIFRSDAPSYTSTSDALISKVGSYYNGTPSLANFEVQSGVTYIIKVGSFYDRSKGLGDTGSSNEGETLTIGYSYAAFDVASYSGAEGALVIESYNGTFRSAVLNGQALEHVSKNGNVITASAIVMDFDTDPNDPKKVTTTITITLDPSTNTYVLESDVSSESVFHVLTEADSGTIYSTVVGDDGNLWAAFSPVSSGYISVDETTSTSSDGFVAIYESTAASFVSANAVVKADYGGTASGGGKISNFMASAGKTYIIKAGNYYDRDKDLGASGSQYAGQTEAIKFEFSSILSQTFNDENGANPLVLSTEDGEFRGATLNGLDIPNATYTDNGDGTLTIVSHGEATIDNTDPTNPTRSSTDNTYTIDVNAGTYSVASVTNSGPVYAEIVNASETISQVVAGDGNLWAKFTPAADGYLTIEETVSTTSDGYLSLFESTAASYTATNAVKTADSGAALSGAGKISNFTVTAGKTYIIKAGAWGDRNRVVGDSGSANSGKLETIAVDYAAFATKTYSGANGDLAIKTAGADIVSVTLNGGALSNFSFDADGNLVISGTPTYDTSDRTDPKKTSTDTVYVLDEATSSYVANIEVHTTNLFIEVTGNSGDYSQVVGEDGNLWLRFTAPADGEITVEELGGLGSVDTYLAIYAANAAAYTDSYSNKNSLVHADDGYSGSLETIEDFSVTAGETYIIKAGAYGDIGKVVGSTGSTNAGKTESVRFSFAAYSTQVYTCDGAADLTITKKGDELMNARLGDQALENASLDENGNLVVNLGIIQDEDGNSVEAKYVFTLNDDNTYTSEKVSNALVESNDYTIAQGATYGFTYDEAAGTYTSSNAGQGSSSATMSITVNSAGALTFHYDCESEGASTLWDYLTITVNGVALADLPARIGGENGMSGDVVIQVNSGDVIKFEYKKDFSGNTGRDNAIISNLHLLVVGSAE